MAIEQSIYVAFARDEMPVLVLENTAEKYG